MVTAHGNAPASTAPPGSRPTNSLSRAWTAVALIPVTFMVAFAIGEGSYAALGYQPEDATEPVWVALVAGVPAIAVFLVPCCAAVLYGNRARAEGRRGGWAPLAIGAVAGVWMVVMNVVSLLVG